MFDKLVRYWIAIMGILCGTSIILLFCGFKDIAMVLFVAYSLLLAIGLIIGCIVGIVNNKF